ncbi:hypothetical protein E2C01_055980 [Portunus trituberculatus]|uniref:Uncharacterized protein n=1 Tax=Portunus trituberculatus TaxID=210409 RepID=A0A5B7GW69_PORTR|nr:hypothetical protein [Portunus trituberculatus]
MDQLKHVFLIGSSESKAFKCVGLNITSYKDGSFTLDQFNYAATLTPMTVSCQRANVKAGEISKSERSEHRALVGQLNWTATHTHPDIAFDLACSEVHKTSHSYIRRYRQRSKLSEAVSLEDSWEASPAREKVSIVGQGGVIVNQPSALAPIHSWPPSLQYGMSFHIIPSCAVSPHLVLPSVLGGAEMLMSEGGSTVM